MVADIDSKTSSFSFQIVPISVVIPQAMTDGRIQWPGDPSIRQTFSFPDSISYYIAKNPLSAKVYLKLAQSCKFFFEKNPILVVARIHGNTKICSKTLQECESNDGKCCVNLDIKKLLSKIWLTETLTLHENTIPNYISLLCPKIYRSEINLLKLYGKTVFLDDFKILASCVDMLGIESVKISNNDGSVVSIDEILQCFPRLKLFDFRFNNDKSTSSFKSLAKLNDLIDLEVLFLFSIPEIIPVEYLSNFIKAYKGMLLLDFDDTISEDYKDQLDALVDAIIESEVPNQTVRYGGQNQEKFKIMQNRMDPFVKERLL